MIDFEKLDIDERMFGEWILSELSANDARFGDAETHSNRLRELSEAYSSQTKLLRGGLAKFVG
jgi:hypothetical protein